jgi:hypothetical protein
MDRLAELAGYAQSFPGMVDEDFIAAGFTPEEISSYRSQTDPQRMTPEEISLMADRYGTLQEPDYTLRERAVQGSQDILSNTFGMNPYNAGVLSRNVLGDPNSSGSNYGMGLADFTPLGALFAVQEGSRTASRGYEAGDPVQMGLGGLEVLLGVAEGVPLAGAAVKPLSKAVINTVEEVFDSPFGAEVIGNLRAMRDLDADFLRGRGDPALAQGVGADVVQNGPNVKRPDQVLVRMPIEDIEHGESAFPGGKLTFPGSQDLIRDYANRGTPLPPIDIMSIEDDGLGKAFIADGSHRYEAARLRGDKFIDAYVSKDELADLPSAQIQEADAPGRPPLTFDEVEAAMKAEAPAPQGIKAYQGSPHDFAAERLVRYPDGSTEYIVGSPDVLPDIPAGAEVLEDFPFGRMRMDKIGTGEGAQAYGHGMYVAEAEDVAKGYKDNISSQALDGAQAVLQRVGGDVDAAIADRVKSLSRFEERYSQGDIDDRLYQFMKNLGRGQIEQLKQYKKQGYFSKGHMYEVNINAATADFLDWDAPLSAQPAARKLGIPSQVELDDLTSEIRALEARGANASDADMTTLEGFFNAPWKNPELHEEWAAKVEARNQMLRAQDTYGGDVPSLVRASNYTSGLPGTRDGVAKHLMERGIPGIKYLDAGSRGTSDATRNFVVFDEKLISIVKKYGIAGAATMLGVSALDVEQALADNLAPSDWEDLVAGPVVETVSSIKEKYPLFSDIEVRDLRDQGVQDGRRLEFTEAYDDRYDKPLIEIFDPALQGEELEQAIIGEFLHEAPRRIPEYAKLREKLQKLKTPQQLQDDMNSYLYDVENYGENRPFEKWDEVSRKDAFIRGHAVGQWEPEYYTDEQKTLIDEMMGLIRSGANK